MSSGSSLITGGSNLIFNDCTSICSAAVSLSFFTKPSASAAELRLKIDCRGESSSWSVFICLAPSATAAPPAAPQPTRCSSCTWPCRLSNWPSPSTMSLQTRHSSQKLLLRLVQACCRRKWLSRCGLSARFTSPTSVPASIVYAQYLQRAAMIWRGRANPLLPLTALASPCADRTWISAARALPTPLPNDWPQSVHIKQESLLVRGFASGWGIPAGGLLFCATTLAADSFDSRRRRRRLSWLVSVGLGCRAGDLAWCSGGENRRSFPATSVIGRWWESATEEWAACCGLLSESVRWGGNISLALPKLNQIPYYINMYYILFIHY